MADYDIKNSGSSKRPLVTLLLGGGWVASRYAKKMASSEHPVIITCRTAEKSEAAIVDLRESKTLEDSANVIEFDLNRQETWKNLPSNLSSIFITWALESSQMQLLMDLLASYTSDSKFDVPVICLGTTSIYDVPAGEPTLDENSILKAEGTPLRDRADSEARILSLGGAVLHLSGLCGDDRLLKPFFEKGWVRNGIDLVNLIPIDAVVKVMLAFTDVNRYKEIIGKRINVSAGAFRYSDIAEGLSVQCPESKSPPSPTSKIINTLRLKEVLGEDFVNAFTLPVENIKPVSRGW